MDTTPRLLTRGMRGVLVVGGAAVLIAGAQLYVLSEDTDRWFAWTIGSPLTAAFLGGWYWTALAAAALGARQPRWSASRAPIPGVMAFIWMTLATTLLHLDLFHLDDGPFSARVAGWAWLVVYLVAPPAETFFYVRQLRAPGVDLHSGHRLAAPFRVVTALLGAGAVVLGAGLFVHPPWSATVSPWALTPLTARAAAAWVVGWGVVYLVASVVDDWVALRSTAASTVVLVVLQLGALARYGDEIDWDRPVAAAYLAALVVLLAGGAYGVVRANRGSGVPIASAR